MGETFLAAKTAGIAVGALAVADSAPAAALTGDQIGDLVKKLPANYETAQSVCGELISGGADAVALLVEMVGDEFGDPAGAQAKLALHGLAHYVCRPDAKNERSLLAETLAKHLQADHSEDLKAFVVRQLQLCGREQEVPALAELLKHDRLCDPAAQALVAIGGKRAESALASAVAGASVSRRASMETALAQLKSR